MLLDVMSQRLRLRCCHQLTSSRTLRGLAVPFTQLLRVHTGQGGSGGLSSLIFSSRTR